MCKRARVHKRGVQQAPLALESSGECCEPQLEESSLGGAANMATPSKEIVTGIVGGNRSPFEHGQGDIELQGVQDVIVLDSEEEGELVEVSGGVGGGSNKNVVAGSAVRSGSFLQWIPRVVSPMVHRVQESEVANQSVYRAGEQVEFRDEQGSVLRGNICGVSREDGSVGSAQVRLDFWHQDPRAYRPGCEAAHVSGGHWTTSAHQRFGQPAGGQVLVEVRAPPGQRMEERVQSGAVRLTARESASRDGGSLDPILSVHIAGALVEEELDYEEDIPVSGEQAVTVQQATMSGQAVQGDRLSGSRDVTANLRRGEVSRKYDGGLVSGGDGRIVVRPIRNVDVAIQAGDGVKESKSEGSMGTAQEVAGCVGGPDGGCTVWIVGHSFVRWAEKQAASRHFGKQLGLDGARIRISWVGKSGMRGRVLTAKSADHATKSAVYLSQDGTMASADASDQWNAMSMRISNLLDAQLRTLFVRLGVIEDKLVDL
ncbi:hypothetical protein NDU88_010442 [Pleurodeles waltl]|uniref:Uncharacterized protein n=1 Tax=Pleurodeles waltl TaxID=8319 RepID=A0AAV7S194_PLEWA|nr:hypothetical protein NDU88_010442 [Pleurodeles waltl]